MADDIRPGFGLVRNKDGSKEVLPMNAINGRRPAKTEDGRNVLNWSDVEADVQTLAARQ